MLCYFIYIIWVDVHKLDIVVFTLPEHHSFSTFINFSTCSIQIFFQSSVLTAITPLPTLRQLTSTVYLFFLMRRLAILNKSQRSRKINPYHLPSFLIHSHIYYSLGIFLFLSGFLPIFLILTLFLNPK